MRLDRSIWRGLVMLAVLGGLSAAQAQPQRRVFELGDGPWQYTTFEQGTEVTVSVVTRGLFRPWALAFVPGTADADNPMGDALITENRGRVLLLRDGRLEPEPIADLSSLSVEQLFDIALHPDFASNGWVYLTYLKRAARPDGTDGYWAASAFARGRFDGNRIVDVEEVFAANAWRETPGGNSTRIMFLPDGKLLMSSSHRLDPDAPQRLDTHIGKVLRLNDDGSAPDDNPFVGAAGALPEIYSYGHRTIMGFVEHPDTGEIWELENGPHGGDEVNVLVPGGNFGWPVVTYGREYDGTRVPQPWREGMLQPELFWVPSITVSSMTFYTADAFPAWKGNLFVTAMNMGRLPGTGHVQRIVFNENGEVRREQLLTDLRQRIRYVGQGPDGLLYLLTDEADGALLRLSPADMPEEPQPPASGTSAVPAAPATTARSAAAARPRAAQPAAAPPAAAGPAAAQPAAAAGSAGAAQPAAAAGSAGAAQPTAAAGPAAAQLATAAGPAPAAGSPMFAGYDCVACHDVDRRVLGPSYRDIARQYPPTDENIRLLALRIIDGSVGTWGETPMVPHAGLGMDLARGMVEQILALEN